MVLLPIEFKNNQLILLDQRQLPTKEEFIVCQTIEDGYNAIKNMVVRGAPCIGFTGIFSMALWVYKNPEYTEIELKEAGDFLKSARPTAVNLAYEVDRIIADLLAEDFEKAKAYDFLCEFGKKQFDQSEADHRNMAMIAEKELDDTLGKKEYRILTHCNTGFLACGSIGTALGVVQHLGEKNRIEMTWVDETRPYLQGSRLTAFELTKLEIPHKIVVEGAASYLMKNGLVDAIFVGADRIVKNGDTANKVGTSNLSIIAKHYNIPFYVVAPSSTFDLESLEGKDIEIELRDEKEILDYKEHRIAPCKSSALNPSFDITDGSLITGIISESGIAKGNYKQTLQRIVKNG